MKKFTKSIFIALVALMCAGNLTAQQQYTITVSSANPPQHGIVAPFDPVILLEGEPMHIHAAAAGGYKFVNWTENGEEFSVECIYTFIVTRDYNLVGHFSPVDCNIILTANPPEGGTVEGSGVYEYGSLATVTATPEPNYEFIYWTNEYGEPFSTDQQFTFSVMQSRTLTAHFGIAASFEVTVSANLQEGGTVTGGGVYEYGSLATVTATPNEPNYVFSGWYENGNLVSAEPVYTFTVNGSRTLVANFAPITYNIILSVNPPQSGITSGNGTFPFDTHVFVGAIANLNWNFINWTEEGVEVSTDDFYTFVVTGDRHLVANFEPATYDITLIPNPPEGGTVTGGGAYTIGTPVTVSAEAHSNYLFINWTENGNIASTEASYSFSMSGPRNLVANFVPSTCEITLSKNIEEGGTLVGAGIYPYGQMVIVHAIQNLPEYEFVNWTEDGNVVSYSPIISAFQITQSRHFVANFIPATYEYSVYANPYEGGAVTGGGVYTYGDHVILAASANEGYQFLNWTRFIYGNGTVVSTEPIYSFQVTGEICAYVAYFVQETKVTVLINVPGGEVLGGGTYHYGDEVTLEAIPHSGYKFVSWTEGRGVISTDNPYTFTVTEDKVIVAIFEEDETLSIEPIDAGAMMLYPNPTNSDMTVVLNNSALKITEMELYDLTGRKVHQQTVNQSSGTLQLNELAQGAYILKVYLDQGEVVTCRIVKN